LGQVEKEKGHKEALLIISFIRYGFCIKKLFNVPLPFVSSITSKTTQKNNIFSSKKCGNRDSGQGKGCNFLIP
jgi:hypothetical protein